jgi:hypothetical protein
MSSFEVSNLKTNPNWLMAKIDTTARANKAKDKYKVTNWSSYNEGLKQRGSLTIWLETGLEASWYYQGVARRGGQFEYSNDCIVFLLTLKVVYKLAFRQLEGFATSLIKLLGLDVLVPSYTQICRRQRSLEVPLSIREGLKKGEGLHVVIDSSGLKVYGEGEWKVRKHGYSKRRAWRKIQLAVDERTGEILAQVLTDNKTDDAAVLPDLMDGVEAEGIRVNKTGADGAYDTIACWQTLIDRGIEPIIPPRENAVYWLDENDVLLDHPRNHALRRIDEDDLEANRTQWKQESGYHRRSKSESTFFRWKMVHGEKMYARKIKNQQTEAAVKSAVLNRFIQIAAPRAVKIA